jgi:large subunit ribosomal protein L24
MPTRRLKQPERTRIRFKKGDRVRVISGRDRGQEGEIIDILRDSGRVFVRDVNVVTKAERPTQENPQGGFAKMEGSIHASNVQLLDPETGELSRIGTAYEDGKKVRISIKSGAKLDQQEEE